MASLTVNICVIYFYKMTGKLTLLECLSISITLTQIVSFDTLIKVVWVWNKQIYENVLRLTLNSWRPKRGVRSIGWETLLLDIKAVPLQAWSGPECSRKLKFPDFKTTAHGGGKVVSPTHRPHLPPGNSPRTHFC